MTVKLRDIEKVAEEATPGPWYLDAHGDSGVFTEPRVSDTSEDVASAYRAEDEAFIAASRTAIPALTAALRGVLALHWPVEVEPSDTICAACSSVRGTGDSLRYFPYTEWPCPTVDAITAHVDLS